MLAGYRDPETVRRQTDSLLLGADGPYEPLPFRHLLRLGGDHDYLLVCLECHAPPVIAELSPSSRLEAANVLLGPGRAIKTASFQIATPQHCLLTLQAVPENPIR